MRKMTGWILILFFAVSCYSAFADGSVVFALTDGKPTELPEKAWAYTCEIESENLAAEQIISLKKTPLDNGYSRYTLEHHFPAGYDMYFFGVGKGSRVTSQNAEGKTSGEQDTVVFDISDLEASSAEFLNLCVNKKKKDRMFITFKTNSQTSVRFLLSAEKPAEGAEEKLEYIVDDQSEAIGRSSIISLKRTQLENGYSRYTLEHCLPAGYTAAYFGSANNPKVKFHAGQGETTGEQDVITFDLPDEDARTDDSIILNIYKADDDRMFISFTPFFSMAGERDVFPTTSGKPVDGKEIPLEYEVIPWTGLTGEGNIVGMKRIQLDNGYSRYILEHHMPAGYIMNTFGEGTFYKPKAQQGKRVTSGDRETVTFDIADHELKGLYTFGFNFYSHDTGDKLIVSFRPFVDGCVDFQLTKGRPAEETEEGIAFSTEGSVPGWDGAIAVSLKKVTLDNRYYSRYTLETEIPEGYIVDIFEDNPSFSMLPQTGDETTSGGPATLIFDLKDQEVKNVGTVIVSFSKPNENRLFVYFSPFE